MSNVSYEVQMLAVSEVKPPQRYLSVAVGPRPPKVAGTTARMPAMQVHLK